MPAPRTVISTQGSVVLGLEFDIEENSIETGRKGINYVSQQTGVLNYY